jgi:NhaA family Na+:H+ antiporter
MPHAERDSGMFQSLDEDQDGVHDEHDTMNEFEHFFKPIVDVGLLFFGFANAGVVLSSEALTSAPTLVIVGSLLIGKTVGVSLFCFIANKAGLELPEHMTLPQTVVLGLLAGIGFTVALFVTTVYVGMADDPALSGIAGQLKLGALLSFFAGPLGFLLAKLIGVKKIHHREGSDSAHAH